MAGGIACAIGTAIPLSASTAADEPVEEIVVAVEARPSALAELPSSASLLLARDLEASGIEATLGLWVREPSLVFSTATALGQPYLRGVGSDLFSVGADPSVATFVDEVYQPRAVTAIQDLYDVRAIEIAKGPQGTLRGRNVTGGAIHVLTRDPEPEIGADVDFSYGSFDSVRVRGALNLPLAGERAVLRVAGMGLWRDGTTRNLFLDERLDDRDHWGVRSKLKLAPVDSLSIVLSGDVSREQSSRALVAKLGEPLSGSPAFALGGTVPADPREALIDHPTFADVRAWGSSARIDWTAPLATVRSISGYRESRLRETIDLDATELDFLTNDPREESRTFSQEIRAASAGESPLDWLAGAFYLHEAAEQRIDVRSGFLGLVDQPMASLRTDAFGLFGDVRKQVTKALRVGAGLRYSRERKHWDFRELFNDVLVSDFDRAKAWSSWMPRVWLEVEPHRSLFLYAKASRGFKSGGFNSSVAQTAPFDPESVWSYEGGLRGEHPRGVATGHVGVFYYDYSDIQLQTLAPDSPVPIPLVRNAGTARIWGAELEGSVRPSEGLLLETSLMFLDARFSDLEAVDPNDPDPAQSVDRSGNVLARAPRFGAYAAAEWSRDLSGFGIASLRAEYRYQSQLFFDVFEDRFTSQGSTHILNARLSLLRSGGAWEVALIGQNLTDALVARNKIRLDGQFGNAQFWTDPRTIRVTVAVHY